MGIVASRLKLSPRNHLERWSQRGNQISLEDTQMKSIKALFIITALTASSLAMAEGGGDRVIAHMEQARKVSMDYQLAQKQKAEAPVAESKAKATGHASC